MIETNLSAAEGRRLIKDAAAAVGGVCKLSLALGLSRAAVSYWDRVPEAHLLAVERITGTPRRKLRPDLYAPRQ